MENILNYGPKRIKINEVKRGTREVVVSERNVMPLSEASLNKMMEHGKTGMVIISSNVSEIDREDPNISLRDEYNNWVTKYHGGPNGIDSDDVMDQEREWLRRRNAHADKELKKDIHKAGFSYTPVYGGYHGKDGVEDSYEPSYVVYCYDRTGQLRDFKDLLDFALKMCRKFKQESVYVQAPGEPPVYLDGQGNQINTSSTNNFKFNRGNETYYTTTGRDKNHPQRFTGDIIFNECYIPLRPGDYNERLRRDKSGEYIL